ncbi:plasmid mobilization protein [Roseateles sp. DB2]|uniref:plasmid mobilization protein n=1 Tax=Roseateles sp. DB2 TaxID=3453717 RepID=UPI003EEA380A
MLPLPLQNFMRQQPITVDQSKRAKRRGPVPAAPSELRTLHVSVRLNADEMIALDAARASVRMQRGEFLRAAALHQLPPTIPALNRDAWIELSRAAGALAQIARRVNLAHAGAAELLPELSEMTAVLADFRRSLIGAEVRP